MRVKYFDTVDCKLVYIGDNGENVEFKMDGVEILTDPVYKEGFGADELCQIYYTYDGNRFYRYENGKPYS